MNEYTIQIGGIPHTVLLSDKDAEKYGDGAVPVKAAKAPANKGRSTRSKAKVPDPATNPDDADAEE